MIPTQHPARRAPSRRAALKALAAILAAGCSGRAVSTPVDPERARAALRTTLDAWKRGDTPESLKTASPPIVAQDFDWMGGATLVAYELTDDGKEDGPNLQIPVKLTLKPPQGAEVEKPVAYVVGTSPSLTVFRAFP